jgi:rubredoxin
MTYTEEQRAYHREYYRRRRQEVIDYLGGQCVRCGVRDELQFDHIDPALKSYELCHKLNLRTSLEEIDKCQLLCKGHHLEKTAQENTGFAHGTIYAWMMKKCNCGECGIAKHLWLEARNASRRTLGGSRGPYGRSAEHGSYLRYRRGCKCRLCKAANAEVVRNARRNRGA